MRQILGIGIERPSGADADNEVDREVRDYIHTYDAAQALGEQVYNRNTKTTEGLPS
jgi:hypothetical protein